MPNRDHPIKFTFDVADERAVDWADKHAAELITGISETSREAINNAIAEALEHGNLEDAYDVILAAVGDPDRAERIAAHETMMAASEGQRLAWEQAVDDGYLTGNEKRTWIAVGDGPPPSGKTCPICEFLDGQVTDLHGKYVDEDGNEYDGPQAHVGCLPGNSRVTLSGVVIATSERRFQGNLAVIQTAGGNQLRCTINHPVLTEHGWIAAGQLQEGDQVVSCIQREGMFSSDLYNINVPTRIHEIVNSFRISPFVVTVTVPTSTKDFHGDGIDGEIAVIRSNGFLRNALYSKRKQYRSNFSFKFALMGQTLFEGICDFRPMLQRMFFSFRGFMRGLSEQLNFFLGHICESPSVALTDSRSASVGTSNLMLSLFRRHFQPINSSIFTNGSQCNTGRQQFTLNRLVIPKVVPSLNFLKTVIGQVQLDKIVAIHREVYSSHVYNLETEHGWYVAEGIVVGNCRCTEGIVS